MIEPTGRGKEGASAGAGGLASPWWENRPALFRFVRDLVVHEMARLRPTALVDRAGLVEPTAIDDRDATSLGADSLEVMALATALAESLQLTRSGVEDRLLVKRSLGGWLDTAVCGLSTFDAEIVFGSSGSTGQPKALTHAVVELEEEAGALAALFSDRRRVVCLVPHHHIYGFLFGILLPRHLGVPCFDRAGGVALGLSAVLEPGDLIIGFPDFWRGFVRVVGQERNGLPADLHGTTSTAPCPSELAWAVSTTGVERLVQVYGASETAGLGWRDTPEGPYRLFPFWERGPAGDRQLVRRLSGGGQRMHEAPDALTFLDSARFLVGSRRDSLVQVAGTNVSLGRVAEILRQHPRVADAAVRLMQPEEGHRLKAFIVPSEPFVTEADRHALEASLTAHVNTHLTLPERPRAFTFGAAVPTSAMGKTADWSITPSRRGLTGSSVGGQG